MTISIIIPVLDENARLAATLAALRVPEGVGHEIIVVDGGSSDATVATARRCGARVAAAPRGRASQMNRGAELARGDVILFLHADTILPPDAFARIAAALADRRIAGGCFRLGFDHRHPVLRFSSFCTRFPVPLFHYGDSAFFVRADIFRRFGGYRPLRIMEDLDFWMRLGRAHPTRIIDAAVTASARRYRENGVVRQQWRSARVVVMYLRGADEEEIVRRYHGASSKFSIQNSK